MNPDIRRANGKWHIYKIGGEWHAWNDGGYDAGTWREFQYALRFVLWMLA